MSSKFNDVEFIAVDPNARETVSGLSLMLAAYGVILGVLLLYAIVLALRARATGRAIARLERRLAASSKKNR